jgi:dGTPase
VHPAPLAHLCFPAEHSRGRRYPEPAHAYRNEFERDRGRVTHARAFRRLEDKTQVFTAGLSDHFRNRLTHTIEVAQIARTAARALGLNEDLTETLALAHDIGHPPFAHAGEVELDRLMRRWGESFDHNSHALRIVESLETPYARFPGLNLTFEVREGIVKHSRDFAPGEFPALDEYLPGQRPPLEAQLIDLADEIAYNAADLDDAYDAGLIDVHAAAKASRKFAELWEQAEMHFPGASDRVRVHEIVRGLLDWSVSGLLEGTLAAAGTLADVEAVRTHPARVARFTPQTQEGSAELKRFLRTNVYESDAVVDARTQSIARIEPLFEALLAHPEHLPETYLAQAEGQPLHRTVCDYIAGMTDGFFGRTCAQMRI